MVDQQSFRPLGWFGIIRLGLVQAALGAIVILTTSTLNRVMVVELALAASLPGALVGWHYAVQLSRPRWGYGSDVGGARTPWIIGGMIVLALGGILAAVATLVMASLLWTGVALAVLAFFIIGLGVGAAGTNQLALLATQTDPSRKAAAAALVWIMMIFGFVLTAGIAGAMLDPFSLERLVWVVASVSGVAVIVTVAALFGLERRRTKPLPQTPSAMDFKAAFAEVWAERQARDFTIFVFVSMLAYSFRTWCSSPLPGLFMAIRPGNPRRWPERKMAAC